MIKKTLAAALIGAISLPVLAFGQTAEGDPDSLRETYASWSVECDSIGENAGQFCRMTQTLRRNDTRQPVLSVIIQAEVEDADGWITLITPFGVALEEGVEITINGANILEGAYRTCRARGCVVQEPLDELAINGLRAGDEAIVSIPMVNGQILELPIALDGFTAAWTRLQDM